MKILVTGARGMVGSALIPELHNHKVLAPEKHVLNIGNVSQVMKFKDERPDFIVHAAAETDHEYCDENPPNTYFINTIGTANLTRLAMSLNIPILYVSAGSVFDGQKITPYFRTERPNPLNHYNTSKWYGEMIVSQHHKHYILRAGWMFGGGPKVDKKFVNKIMVKINRGDKEIKVCNDCFGSPTYSVDLAKAIAEVISKIKIFGTYHCVNGNNGCSRFEFAQEIVKILKRKVKIIPCKIDDLKDEFPCKRTNYEVLFGNFDLRPWEEALKEYINAYYRN